MQRARKFPLIRNEQVMRGGRGEGEGGGLLVFQRGWGKGEGDAWPEPECLIVGTGKRGSEAWIRRGMKCAVWGLSERERWGSGFIWCEFIANSRHQKRIHSDAGMGFQLMGTASLDSKAL